MNNQFACALDASRPSKMREPLEALGGTAEKRVHLRRCGRIIASDIVHEGIALGLSYG
jgi:hypothetical protein